MDLVETTILRTGQTNINGDVEVTITITDEDYQTIQPGDRFTLYWFPNINAATHVLPNSDFTIGGIQETVPDINSNGDGGMIVPTNAGQVLNVYYFDADFTESPSSLPVSRFTAIKIPPSGYQLWRDEVFTPAQIDAGDAAPEADPDGDGLSNLLEYATAQSPLSPGQGPLNLSRMDAATLALQFERVADPELRYRIEATDDLEQSPWPDLVFESSGSDNLAGRIELNQPLGPGQRFLRLQVDALP